MGQQTSDADTESLQKNDRHRGRCLDSFLVTSVIFLFVAVTALAVVGVMVVMKLQSNKESLHIFENKPQGLTGDTPSPAFKMQTFAYLGATSSVLDNTIVKWAPVKYGQGTSLGTNFDFDESQLSLRPRQAGTYFMYINVNVSCTFKCEAGLLSFKVGNKLTCDVELPANRTGMPVSKKCWTVSPLDTEGLVTRMIVPKEGLNNWKLEFPGSGFGMFLVD